MSRRCGSLDPGVVLYLMDEKRMTSAAVSDLLYNSSGLLGVSGVSEDMKTLLASDTTQAAEAVDCSSIASAASWDRSPPPSAGSTPWSSPRASASTRLRSAGASASKRRGSAWRSTKRRTMPAARASRRAQPRLRLDDSDRRRSGDCAAHAASYCRRQRARRTSRPDRRPGSAIRKYTTCGPSRLPGTARREIPRRYRPPANPSSSAAPRRGCSRCRICAAGRR